MKVSVVGAHLQSFKSHGLLKLRGGGGSGLGPYGKIEEDAVDRLKKSHLAPSINLYELVHHLHDKQIGLNEVKAAGSLPFVAPQ
jgi:hypothetical protein